MEQNAETNEMVQGFVNPSLDLVPFETGSKGSHIDYINSEKEGFYLEMKVTQK